MDFQDFLKRGNMEMVLVKVGNPKVGAGANLLNRLRIFKTKAPAPIESRAKIPGISQELEPIYFDDDRGMVEQRDFHSFVSPIFGET